MRARLRLLILWCTAGTLLASGAHAQVAANPGSGRTITIAWPGIAPQTAPLLAVTGLPVGTAPGDDPGLATPGAQGKPRAAGRPPQGPLVVTVSDAGPVGQLMLRAEKCLALGQRCVFDVTLATASGTFIASGASVTQIQVLPSSTGGKAYQAALATASLTRQ